MDNIEVASLVFESIKQNWAKNGSFRSLVEIVCQRLDVLVTEEICERLKKSDALWLNNHLEDCLEEETPEERLEFNRAMLGTSEMIKKPVMVTKSQIKNHDYH